MQKKIITRIIFAIGFFVCATLGFWWLIYPAGIVAAWYYRKFYELLIAAFVMDLIYSTSRARLFNFQYSYTLIAFIIFLIVLLLKSRVRKEIWQKNY